MYAIVRNNKQSTEHKYLLDNAIGLAKSTFDSEGKKNNDTITVVNQDNKIIKTFK